MAIDVYLQIEGIKGESADSKHQGWIEVSSAQWGRSATHDRTRIGYRRAYVRTQRISHFVDRQAG